MKLQDVCSLIVDSEHKTAPSGGIGHPMIRTPNIGRGRFHLNGVRRVTDEIYVKWTRRATPQADDLILAREAPVGNVAIIPRGLAPILGQRTVLIRPDPERIYPRYLQYLLLGNEIQARMAALSSGATVAHLNMEDIRSLELPELPDREVQMRLSVVLAAYDESIDNNLRRIEILEEMVHAIYGEWFINLRFPGHEDVALVESSLGLIPEGWDVGPLSTVVDIDPPTPRPSRGQHPFVPMASLTEGRMLISEVQRRDPEAGLTRFVNGDTLFPGINPSLQNGKTAFVAFLSDGEIGLGSTEFMVMRSKSDAPEWVYCLARTEQLRDTAVKSMTGASGRQRVRKDTLRNYPLPIPPPAIAREFSEIARPSFRMIENLRIQNANLHTTRELLLPELVSGDINISELDIDTSWLAV